jgi:hypothetical protein
MVGPKSASLLVPNAIFFITGSDIWDVPEIGRGSPSIWSTPNCIAVGCTPDADGPTKIVMGLTDEVDVTGEPAFDGELKTPNKTVSVSAVPGKTIMEYPASGALTRTRVWINRPRSPNVVTIVLG